MKKKNMAAKLSSLPCFEAFGAIFCPDSCSYLCLVCGGRGSLARFSVGVSSAFRKAFSSKRAFFFHGKGASRASQIPHRHRPPPPPPLSFPAGIFSNPLFVGRGQGGGGSVWNLGSARGPLTVKKRPLFDENAFRKSLIPGGLTRNTKVRQIAVFCF